jgi:hypothetical protein
VASARARSGDDGGNAARGDAQHRDQVEWLDDENVLYADGQDVWTVPSDGSGSATMFIAEALSPAVVRQIP